MIAILIVLGACAVYSFGFFIGYKVGEAAGEEQVLDEVNDYFAKQCHQKGDCK